MKEKALTLVEVMVTLAIIVLLAVIIISSILSPKIITNEKHAKDALKAIARAYEVFAAKHNGSYNETLKNLSNQSIYNPPYISVDYSTGSHEGYTFSCAASAASYVCNARPEILKETGTKSFAICSGGVLKEASGDAAPPCP